MNAVQASHCNYYTHACKAQEHVLHVHLHVEQVQYMCNQLHVYMYMYMCTCTRTHVHVHVHMYMYTCTCTCTCLGGLWLDPWTCLPPSLPHLDDGGAEGLQGGLGQHGRGALLEAAAEEEERLSLDTGVFAG